MRDARWMFLALAAALLTGCAGLQKPEVEVAQVTVTDRTPQGARVEVTVAVANPNDTPLPVHWTDYAVTVDGFDTFEFTGQPAVTLPPRGTQAFTLAAALADGEAPLAGRAYRVDVQVGYEPPGEVRALFTEYGVPLPAVSTAATGRLDEGMQP